VPAAAPAQPAADEPTSADIFTLARQQNFSLARQLLEAFPHLWNARDDEGHTYLHWAALVGNQEFMQLALAKGLEVDALANNKQTPLMWAALRGYTGAARILIEAKASLHMKDSMVLRP
jgi:ankyrin repeat protein